MRTADLIDPTNLHQRCAKTLTGQGRGAARRWIGSAIPRACWSLVPRFQSKSAPLQTSRPRLACSAISASVVSAVLTSSHRHVQKVRNATAQAYVEKQGAKLDSLGNVRYQIVELSLDETEHPVTVDGETETHTILMMHVKIFRRDEHQGHCNDVIIPPALLSDTKSSTLLAAIRKRTGAWLWNPRVEHSVLIMNSDSAKAMIKTSKMLAQSCSPTFSVIHNFCCMHMLWAAIMAMMRVYDLVNGIFCATCLMHKARNRSRLRLALRAHLRHHLQLVYGHPDPVNKVYNKAVLSLLQYADDPTNRFDHTRRDRRARKAEARAEMLDLFNSAWTSEEPLTHHCFPGCRCGGPDQLARKAENLIYTAFLQENPRVPALNKWNKLFHPLAWWFFAGKFHQLVIKLFCAVGKPAGDDHDAPIHFGDAEVFGIGEEDTYQKEQRARFRTG